MLLLVWGFFHMFYLQTQKASRLTELSEEVCLSLSISSAPIKYYGQRRTYTPTYSHTHFPVSQLLNLLGYVLSCEAYSSHIQTYVGNKKQGYPNLNCM